MQPGMGVALDALRREARMWADDAPRQVSIMSHLEEFSMAEVAASTASAVDVLASAEGDLPWVAAETGLEQTYGELRRKAVRLLLQGREVFQSIAETLESAARAYAAGDEENAAELRDQWQPRLPTS